MPFSYTYLHPPCYAAGWCPDCVRADPAIRGALKDQGTLLEVDVGDRIEWRSPGHPLRTELQVTGVPTLICWGKNGAGERLGKQKMTVAIVYAQDLYSLILINTTCQAS